MSGDSRPGIGAKREEDKAPKKNIVTPCTLCLDWIQCARTRCVRAHSARIHSARNNHRTELEKNSSSVEILNSGSARYKRRVTHFLMVSGLCF